MKNIVIICGGQSPEHEISLRSTKNILSALDRSKYQVRVIGISKEGRWLLLDEESLCEFVNESGLEVMIHPGAGDCFRSEKESLGEVDVVFPVLHGPNGEDGSVQGVLEVLGVPYVGPSILGSAMCMDKEVTKRILTLEKIPVAKWVTVRKGSEPLYSEVSDVLGKVMFVKPANMGSSVGISRVESSAEWTDAIKDAFQHDTKLVIEESLQGREIECAMIGNDDAKASGVGEIESGEIYSYDAKYASASSAQVIIPADVSKEELQLLQDTARRSYEALECSGMARVDMFLTDKGEVYVNEVNTIPGFTSISMYPKLWAQEGVSYSDLLDSLIELALDRHAHRK